MQSKAVKSTAAGQMLGRNMNTRSTNDLSVQYAIQASEANLGFKQKKQSIQVTKQKSNLFGQKNAVPKLSTNPVITRSQTALLAAQ